MVSLKFSLEGTDNFIEKVNAKGKMSVVKQLIKKHGAQMYDKTLSNMDRAYIRGYSTGNTKRSTNQVIKNNGLTSEQTTNTSYIEYLEHGTRYMAKEPAIKPAFDEQTEKFKQDLKKLE